MDQLQNSHNAFRRIILLIAGMLLVKTLAALDSNGVSLVHETLLAHTSSATESTNLDALELLCLGAGFVWGALAAFVGYLVWKEVREDRKML